MTAEEILWEYRRMYTDLSEALLVYQESLPEPQFQRFWHAWYDAWRHPATSDAVRAFSFRMMELDEELTKLQLSLSHKGVDVDFGNILRRVPPQELLR